MTRREEDELFKAWLITLGVGGKKASIHVSGRQHVHPENGASVLLHLLPKNKIIMEVRGIIRNPALSESCDYTYILCGKW